MLLRPRSPHLEDALGHAQTDLTAADLNPTFNHLSLVNTPQIRRHCLPGGRHQWGAGSIPGRIQRCTSYVLHQSIELSSGHMIGENSPDLASLSPQEAGTSGVQEAN